MLALGEMCFQGMGAVAKGASGLCTWCYFFLSSWGQLEGGSEVCAPLETCFEGMGPVEGWACFLPIQSNTVLSYYTVLPMGASSGCTVLCPHYLRKLLLFVFSLCLVAIHLCET